MLSLFGSSFVSGYVVVLMLVVPRFIDLLLGPASEVLMMTGDQKLVARVNIVAGVANLGLNLLLVPFWGAVGAATATAVTMISWKTYLFVLCRRRTGVQTSLATRLRALFSTSVARAEPRPRRAESGRKASAMDHVKAPVERAKKPRISVLIPTFRRPQLLPKALASILAQQNCSLDAIEVIVVDNCPDASARPSFERARESAGGRLGLRYLHEPRPGISHARNRALTAARADHVLFLDDDLEAAPQLIATFLQALTQTSAAILVGPIEPVFEATSDGSGDIADADMRNYFPAATRCPTSPTSPTTSPASALPMPSSIDTLAFPISTPSSRRSAFSAVKIR